MAVKRRSRHQSGQSLLEFAFLVPIIIGMLAILVQVETAISVGIVAQKYARSHMHFLMFNHPNILEHGFLQSEADGSFMTRYWIGVDNEVNFGKKPQPKSPKITIGRAKPRGGDDDPEASQRQNVRVRVAAFTCAPLAGTNDGRLLSEEGIQEETFTAGNVKFCTN